MAVPREPLLEGLVLTSGSAEPTQAGELTGEIVGQPLTDGRGELLVVFGCPQPLAYIHPGRITYQALAL
jgi:hypothetical protein